MDVITGDLTYPHTVQKRLHWVKITKNHHDCLYIRIDIPSPSFIKWFWFFRYKAALYQVQFPKANIELKYDSVLADIKKDEMIQHISRQVKRQQNDLLKMIKNRKLAIDHWHELLPIHDSIEFKNYEDKIETGIIRLFKLKEAIVRVNKEDWSMALWNDHYK